MTIYEICCHLGEAFGARAVVVRDTGVRGCYCFDGSLGAVYVDLIQGEDVHLRGIQRNGSQVTSSAVSMEQVVRFVAEVLGLVPNASGQSADG